MRYAPCSPRRQTQIDLTREEERSVGFDCSQRGKDEGQDGEEYKQARASSPAEGIAAGRISTPRPVQWRGFEVCSGARRCEKGAQGFRRRWGFGPEEVKGSTVRREEGWFQGGRDHVS